MWEILSEIFGIGRYEFQVQFANKSKVNIKAKDFIHAVEKAEAEYSLIAVLVRPLEDVTYSKASRGANMYVYNAIAHADVFAEDELQAKSNFKNYLDKKNISIVEAKELIWVNKKHYRGGNNA